MNEKTGIITDARTLGIPKMLILGLQHMFAMFGATILVPILVNSYFVDGLPFLLHCFVPDSERSCFMYAPNLRFLHF